MPQHRFDGSWLVLVLVDYDNVHSSLRARGLRHLSQNIGNAIGPSLLGPNPRLRVRLYGGWFDGRTRTRRADHLIGEVGTFPMTIVVGTGALRVTVIVSAELALGLLDEPRVSLTHTFRQRGGAGSIQSYASAMCKVPGSCPLTPMTTLLSSGRCPEAGCTVETEHVLARPEQKLVDTMLTADLITAALHSEKVIAIVSTDDDMIPGIRTALLRGTSVIHLHPVPGRSTPRHYLSTMPAGYRQENI